MKVLSAEFVTSATGVDGIPRDAAPQIALVGRSNVGKSSLINALVRSKIARTSGAAGKTTLLNLYRVTLGGTPARTVYLADLPGYGYARGGARSARAFDALTRAYFAPRAQPPPVAAALLVVDARHPGLDRDLEAHAWLRELDLPMAVVATKMDRMRRAERQRSQRALEQAFGPVHGTSSTSGEGVPELWRVIVGLA